MILSFVGYLIYSVLLNFFSFSFDLQAHEASSFYQGKMEGLLNLKSM